jgi:hypothetical protein
MVGVLPTLVLMQILAARNTGREVTIAANDADSEDSGREFRARSEPISGPFGS